MFVLGIDPGLSRCGFGAVRTDARHQPSAVEHGVLHTPHTSPLHERLASMHAQLEDLLVRLQPDVVVVERVFFQTNARTAMGVGQASGLALALACRQGCQVVQYTSNEVKQAVAGYGSADKHQTQSMVAKLLHLAEVPKPADAADALALALCHLAVAPLLAKTAGAMSLGPSVAAGPAGAYGGRPLRIASSVGGVPLARPATPRPTTPRPATPRPTGSGR